MATILDPSHISTFFLSLPLPFHHFHTSFASATGTASVSFHPLDLRSHDLTLKMALSKRVNDAITRANDANRAGPIIVSPPANRPVPFTVEEDDLILRLRSTTQLSWPEIGARFPERGRRADISVQVRQSRGLNAKAMADVNAFRSHFGITANSLQNDVHFTRANGAHIRTPGSNVAVPAYGLVTPTTGAPQVVIPSAVIVPSVAPIPTLPAPTPASSSEIAPIAASSDSSSLLSEAPRTPVLDAQEPPAPAPIPIASSEHPKEASESTALPDPSASAPPAPVVPQPTVAPVQTGRPARPVRARVPAPAATAPKSAPVRRAVGTRVQPLRAPPGGWHEWLSAPVPDITHRGTPEHARLEAELKAHTATFPFFPESNYRADFAWSAPVPQTFVEKELEDARIEREEAQAAALAPRPAVIPIEDLETSELAALLELPKESNFPTSEILQRAKWHIKPYAVRFDGKEWRRPKAAPKPAPKKRAAAAVVDAPMETRAAKKARQG
ncbi:uncharacterized protein BDZ99DRAFT_569141 [Mytilinidion resinicola]|uniref:Uncharacterized protein n=1 Tax=Mytilinidion resinicola TaxID=574789 RepID=A0A6A6YV99_9PEZI|nr:uncharacterized protein BDZ99DRAFT_569141 [Mytilinidion resinicola]KAF2812468.1 hypothetical protein BDZ99DRAFT_569141 [Mytilinidion resinicola]